ncbi:Amt family ammonium transporter [Inquilinus ginsengisoli]|uniref:ammonium transporter n=1 Tax=Inquilinus ginsengisoli TaxID=363840 RepID=UPI003D1C939D
MKRTFWGTGLAGAALLLALPALAQDAPAVPDSGATAWMQTSTLLVLMMAIPGLALFYGGMVRKANVLSMLMQCFATTCLISIAWMVLGYSLAFTNGGAYLGDLSRFFLNGLPVSGVFTLGAGGAATPVATVIPESVYMMFQMTFAAITPALIVGAFADRMKFSSLLVFVLLWSLIVYAPVAHWVWQPNGWLFAMGVLDFAGGTVVHINAGIAGLVACIVIGKRKGYGTGAAHAFAPHNLVYSVIGASLLWVGWFGFNAGSWLAADGRSGMAFTTTHIATAAAALSWMFAEWAAKGKPSVLGVISGAVAGLVAITPACGFVNPTGALVIGIVAGIVCFIASTSVKKAFGYDDSLDVFGVHGVGGIVGALLTGVFADPSISAGAGDYAGLLYGNAHQFVVQVYGVVASLVWSGVVTLVLLLLIKAVMGLRVSEEAERDGLDLAVHGEAVQ